jgi:adenylate cyclase
LTKTDDTERRLAAIFAADVEGYSRLMGADEVSTLQALTDRRSILDALIFAHRGRIANTAGDSVLAEFGSAVDAVKCAVAAQAALAEANTELSPDRCINFRMGVHVGDVMVRSGDLFGDGVNIASRLQTLAQAGGVCISGVAHDQVRKILPLVFTDLGEQSVKNIEEPIRVYTIGVRIAHDAPISSATLPEVSKRLPLPDKPSIAVLPFQNMSGDPEQDYFADGMVDDILTALSRFKSLFVIARNSSFTYKGKAVDIKQVGRELGVRYVLEGSVRKSAGRVRITGQLIDAATGMHLWADRFEGDMSDIFALQDEVTINVVSAIEPKLLKNEIELASRRRPDNLSAYDLFLRALPHHYSMTREGLAEAVRLCYRALELDPRYGSAAGLAGACQILQIALGYVTNLKSEAEEAKRLLQLSLSIDENDPDTLATVGWATAQLFGDFDTATEMVDRAVALNPNFAFAWNLRGWTYRLAGQEEEAIRSFERTIRLSPLDPMLYTTFAGMGIALIGLQRFDEAVEVAKKALRKNPSFAPSYRCLAAALAHLGREAEAREAVTRLLELDPNFRISEFTARGHWRAQLFIQGLRKAGLPE